MQNVSALKMIYIYIYIHNIPLCNDLLFLCSTNGMSNSCVLKVFYRCKNVLKTIIIHHKVVTSDDSPKSLPNMHMHYSCMIMHMHYSCMITILLLLVFVVYCFIFSLLFCI